MERKKIYPSIAALSSFIRIFILPGPFDAHKHKYVLNFYIEFPLYAITFLTVGLFYKRRSNPTLGSILYLFFYWVHTGLLILWGKFNYSKESAYIIAGIYSVVLISTIVMRIRARIRVW